MLTWKKTQGTLDTRQHIEARKLGIQLAELIGSCHGERFLQELLAEGCVHRAKYGNGARVSMLGEPPPWDQEHLVM